MNTRLTARLANATLAMRQDLIPQFLASVAEMDEGRQAPPLKVEIVAQVPKGARAANDLQSVKGAIAVVSVFGVLGQHRGADFWADTYTDELIPKLADLVAQSNVGAIVLVFDGPGGIVYGTPEAANSIGELSQVKPIYGCVKGEAASATYWLASATTRLFVQPSGKVGSIGVWMAHVNAAGMMEQIGWDVTLISAGKFKTEGHSYGPLPKEAKEYFQESVDRYHDEFLGGVAKGRRTSKAVVKQKFGQGRMIDSNNAWGKGMVDDVATLPEVLAALMPQAGRRVSRPRSTSSARATRQGRLRAELKRASEWPG